MVGPLIPLPGVPAFNVSFELSQAADRISFGESAEEELANVKAAREFLVGRSDLSETYSNICNLAELSHLPVSAIKKALQQMPLQLN